MQHLASSPLWEYQKRAWTYTQSKDCPCAMATTRSKTHKTNKTHKSTNPTKAKQNKSTKRKTGKKTHHRNGQVNSMRIAAAYVLTVEPCMHRNNTETRQITGKGAKRSSPRSGNPNSKKTPPNTKTKQQKERETIVMQIYQQLVC